jgi:hypothetical protein
MLAAVYLLASATHMTKLYSLALLLLVAASAHAQAPAPAPAPVAPTVHVPPTSFKGGAYQLKKGSDWKRAKLLYDAQNLSVSDANHKQQYPLVYPADSVRAFTIGSDTFSVVREVDIPRPSQHLSSLFARNLYHRAGYEVVEYVAVMPEGQPPVVYTLLTQAGRPQAVLPPSSVQFRLALSKVLRDYQALAQQLELDPKIMPEDLPVILTAYGRWKDTSGKK